MAKLPLGTGRVNPLPAMRKLPDMEREMVRYMNHNNLHSRGRLMYPFRLKAVRKELRISADKRHALQSHGISP